MGELEAFNTHMTTQTHKKELMKAFYLTFLDTFGNLENIYMLFIKLLSLQPCYTS